MPLTQRPRGQVNVGRQLLLTTLAVLAVITFGTLGYRLLGIDWLDALYATVFTVTTVGFREIVPFDSAQKIFTIVLMLVGAGTVLYTLTLLVAYLIEGHFGSLMGRRRMQNEINRLSDHVIVCGYGRVGRAAASELSAAGQQVVVVDRDEDRLNDCPYPWILGDASSDYTLRQAGVEAAGCLVATLDSDAESLYVTLTARAINADLMIIARARTDDAEPKFTRAGADRVVNPQRLGGDRIAAFARQPHVVDFLDVAMHEDGMEFVLEEIEIRTGSSLVGSTVRDARQHEGGAPLLLAIRERAGGFVTNPPNDRPMNVGDVLIVVGTTQQVSALRSTALSSK